MSEINPYQPPQQDSASHKTEMSPLRKQALWKVRWLVLALIIPVLANWYCYYFVPREIYRSGRIIYEPILMYWQHLAPLNLAIISSILFAVWLFGLKVLELIAIYIHFLMGGRVTQESWLQSMYRSMWTIPYAAVLGAAVWLTWLYCFFLDVRFDKYTVTMVLGTIGHAAAAWIYGTIFYHWYILIRQTLNPVQAKLID